MPVDFDELKDSIESIAGIKGKRDDDFFDRLNNRYTVFIILGMAFVTTFYQIGGEPIYCWAPQHFTGTVKPRVHCWAPQHFTGTVKPRSLESGVTTLDRYSQTTQSVARRHSSTFYSRCS